jgi:hypothetical protein
MAPETDAEDGVSEALPLLSPLYDTRHSQDAGQGIDPVLTTKPKRMGFFDSLKGWDKPKRFRYMLLLALSLSGDGWSVSLLHINGSIA